MFGVISWIIAAISAYGAISGYNILGQETNSASVILLTIVAFICFMIGLVSFSKSSSGSGYGSSSSGSDDGGFFSFMSFDGGSDSGGCDSGGDSGSCGGGD